MKLFVCVSACPNANSPAQSLVWWPPQVAFYNDAQSPDGEANCKRILYRDRFNFSGMRHQLFRIFKLLILVSLAALALILAWEHVSKRMGWVIEKLFLHVFEWTHFKCDHPMSHSLSNPHHHWTCESESNTQKYGLLVSERIQSNKNGSWAASPSVFHTTTKAKMVQSTKRTPTATDKTLAETAMPILFKKSFDMLPQWDFEDVYNQDAPLRDNVSALWHYSWFLQLTDLSVFSKTNTMQT